MPAALTGAIAAIACIGGALSSPGYRQLLHHGGLTVRRSESRPHDAEAFTQRIEERLRGARLLGIGPPEGSPLAIEAARQARAQITGGLLGYTIFIAQ
jgi:hypothetical protein